MRKYYSEIGVPLTKSQLRVPFNTEHKEMLGNVKNFVEHRIVAIDPHFEKLITALRTAKENEGNLDKEGTVHDGLFDAFRLSLSNLGYRSSSLLKCEWISLIPFHTSF